MAPDVWPTLPVRCPPCGRRRAPRSPTSGPHHRRARPVRATGATRGGVGGFLGQVRGCGGGGGVARRGPTVGLAVRGSRPPGLRAAVCPAPSRPMFPPRLRGGAPHKAERRCGVRAGGAGWVGRCCMNTLWGWGRASWAGCGPDVRRGGQTLIMGYSADKSPLIGHLAGPLRRLEPLVAQRQEKCGPNRPTPTGYSCNNAVNHRRGQRPRWAGRMPAACFFFSNAKIFPRNYQSWQ